MLVLLGLVLRSLVAPWYLALKVGLSCLLGRWNWWPCTPAIRISPAQPRLEEPITKAEDPPGRS